MKIQVQVHAQLQSTSIGREYKLSPLLEGELEAAHVDIEPARRRLIAMVAERRQESARALDQRALAAELQPPVLDARAISLKLPDRRRQHLLEMLVVRTRIGDRTVHMLPALDAETFDMRPGEDLIRRAAEVTESWLQRQGAEREERLEELSRTTRAWLETLELELPVSALQTASDDRAVRGDLELERVATLLNLMDPDSRLRPVEREDILGDLARAIESPRPRPVLLVGESLVGKTAIVEEHVAREIEGRGAASRRFFRLAPQRLLAGMAFVGAWEERWLAILSASEVGGHVLVMDDLPGLCRAGVTRDSHVSMAQVARPLLQRGRVRVIGEATHQELELLRERDRAFADCFRVIRVDSPGAVSALRMVLAHARHLEGQRAIDIDREAVVAAWRLGRRRDDLRAMPGKATLVLAEAARMATGSTVAVDDVYEVEARQTGLSPLLVDDRRPLPREEIIARLSRRIHGQPQAVAALADTVLIARAGLADPRRPLGCLLFCGPTGVGKTHASRVLAELLYGDRTRLLRVDMNEFSDHQAVERLVGNSVAPDGILTSGIRRQPGAVVLLDEVEKAHPDVLDLLLQVLGEGRLSDGEGRTVSFASAIIVMTSNLGAGHAAGSHGFSTLGAAEPRADGDEARDEIEGYFRPELANRIDVVIAFERLRTTELEIMARERIEEVRRRSGLIRRRSLLEVDPGLIDRIVQEALSVDHGARALEHTVERLVTAPLAARLTTAPPESPSLLTLSMVAGEVHVECVAFQRAKLVTGRGACVQGTHAELIAAVARAREELARIAIVIESSKPEGAITITSLSTTDLGYFAAREELARLETRLARLKSQVERVTSARASSPGHMTRGWSVGVPGHVQLSASEIEFLWSEVCSGRDSWAAVDEFLTSTRARSSEELLAMRASEILDATREVEALHTSVREVVESPAARLAVTGRGDAATDIPADPDPRRLLHELILGLGGEDAGGAVLLFGPGAARFDECLRGCVLWCAGDVSDSLFEIGLDGEAVASSLPPVHLVLWPRGACLDLVSGVLASQAPTVAVLVRLVRMRMSRTLPPDLASGIST